MTKKKTPIQPDSIESVSASKLQPSLASDQDQTQRSYNIIPVGPAILTYEDALKGGDIAGLALLERHGAITHGAETKVTRTKDGKVRIERKTNNSEITIQFSNFAALKGSNKAAKKMLIFILQEINRQGVVKSDGTLVREILTFPIKRLVECGMYSAERSARTGFDSAIDGLKGDVQGLIKLRGKDRTSTGKTSLTLFPTLSREDGTCSVRLNPDINWESIAPFYTIIPAYAYKLSNRAFDLLIYICTQARQRTDEISKNNGFYLSLRSVQYALNLPDETKTKNPKKDIKQPVADCIDEIMRENDQAKNEGNFSIRLTPEGIEGKRIEAYLNGGKIHVSMQGAYFDYFEGIYKGRARIAESQRQRQERIAEAVQIKKQLAAQDDT